MKKVLLLFSYKKNKLGDYDELTRALNIDSGDHGHKFVRGALKEFEYSVTNGEPRVHDLMNDCDLAEYDLVFFRMWVREYERATAAAAYLDYRNVPFFDPEVYNYRAFSKLTETFLMATANIPVPDTFYAKPQNLLKAFSQKRVDFGFPLILKGVKGLKGNDNYLVEDYAQLESLIANSPDVDFMAQRYIPNDCDYRIWVVGDKVRFIMRRVRAQDSASHLNNTSQGARAELVTPEDLGAEICEQAIEVARRMKRGFAGVDVIIDKETSKHYFLEVNNQPEILSVFIDEKLAALHEYVAEEVRDE